MDSREFIGELLSFDKHYNLVLANTEEFRLTKKSLLSLKDRAKNKTSEPESSLIQEQKRTLGLVILRGEHVISVTIEAPPANAAPKLKQLKQGGGVIKPLTKGTAVGPGASKLSGPVRTSAPGFTGAPKRFNPPPGFKK
ncbi:Small nuclear ribonucleoprotein-associated protein B [Cyberlindnera fabianii]|nr:Small nuclear ribonucleoprotein-associated protein B [Cyberlindnera fabianii]